VGAAFTFSVGCILIIPDNLLLGTESELEMVNNDVFVADYELRLVMIAVVMCCSSTMAKQTLMV